MWEIEWQALARRLSTWSASAEMFLRILANMPADGMKQAASNTLEHEFQQLLAGIRALALPAPLRTALTDTENRLGPLMNQPDNASPYLIASRCVAVAALRAPLDQAVTRSEEP